jgi:hypothetical protein
MIPPYEGGDIQMIIDAEAPIMDQVKEASFLLYFHHCFIL